MEAPATVLCVLAIAGLASAQNRSVYQEVSTAHVKMERVKDWEDNVHKLIDVNRRLKGDTWITLQTEFGDSGAFLISTARRDMASVQSGMEAFMRALKEGMGPTADKVMRDLASQTNSFKSELRRRRWDLSVHAPEDAAGNQKMVGQSRWIRTVRVDVKPGRASEYIEAWKKFQAELEKVSPPVTALVSESVTGRPALTVAIYHKSMAEMDEQNAGVQKAVASPAYANLMKVSGEAVSMTNWEIHRVRPDLSNPPEGIINADPSFWKAPVVTTTTKKSSTGSADRK
jgi:hypothetical protein